MVVSKDRFERTEQEIASTASMTAPKNVSVNLEAATALEAPITEREIERELDLIKDSTPGNDGVRMAALKVVSDGVKDLVYKCIIDVLNMDPELWPEETKEGWLIPLHKKGTRNDLNNYRGVCLLPLVSRTIARVFASRLRVWAEKIEVMEENQNGFRKGRSTADATQVITRINEETRRVLGETSEGQGRRPGAVLLDITKAYPRVNRVLLWKILENLRMPHSVLKILKCLHEQTQYRVKGREGLSEPWTPQRGLREGCATSPILFNVYHSEAMKRAAEERKKLAASNNHDYGLVWLCNRGNNLPPTDINKGIKSSTREEYRISESLFADDSTLIGWTDELVQGKEAVKKAMYEFEERCHDGKEESAAFGTHEMRKIKMLGTLIGKTEDRNARTKRGSQAWFKVKKWLWKSTLSKRTKALIVQGVVEASLLFDSNVRSWSATDTDKLQSIADRCYRFVWNNGKAGALLRMQNEGINSFQIRKDLGIESIRTKVEIRALQRLGHVLRMPDCRAVKKIVLGNWAEPQTSSGYLRNGLISYWKRMVQEAGEDWTNAGNLASDRMKWKFIRMRHQYLLKWEEAVAEHGRKQEVVNRKQQIQDDGLTCRVEGCGRICKSKSGRATHERRGHRQAGKIFECPGCKRAFPEKAQLTNHYKTCKNRDQQNDEITTNKYTGLRPRVKCPGCGTPITSNNLTKHMTRHGCQDLRTQGPRA